jgi:hypothetical protein
VLLTVRRQCQLVSNKRNISTKQSACQNIYFILRIYFVQNKCVHHTNKFWSNARATVHEFFSVKLNMTLNFKLLSKFAFVVFHKNCLFKSCLSNKDVHECTISWYKFFIHLKILNVCHFRFVKAVGLGSMVSRLPSMAWRPYLIL